MKSTETGSAQVGGGPRVGQDVFGMIRPRRGRQGGGIILCGNRADVNRWGGKARVG